MPSVTGLRETRGGRVVVELDGARWRTIPVDVAAKARLAVGEELDRARLRELARELRRARALDLSLRALARRDHSATSLRRRLGRRNVRGKEAEEAVGRLAEVGLLDDERYARRLAASLADRGFGDAAIRWRLERDGVGLLEVEDALTALEPEAERARRLVEARGRSPRAARELARRGFGEDAVETALGSTVADDA